VALVNQVITATRDYSPFEGMSERQRLVTSVPIGRFLFSVEAALDAKPVNDQINLQITNQLPDGFAYVFSSLSFELQVDTADDWDSISRVTLFNCIPNLAPGNNQIAAFAMSAFKLSAADAEKILNYQLGTPRDWFPNPIDKSRAATGHSLLFNYGNFAATVQAAGTISFHANFYQYELNQAVRFPLNSPFPVGIR